MKHMNDKLAKVTVWLFVAIAAMVIVASVWRRVFFVNNKLTAKEKEILLAFAENSMNSCKGARSLFMSRSSFYYHFNNIRKKTGLNPLNFYDLVKLLGIGG